MRYFLRLFELAESTKDILLLLLESHTVHLSAFRRVPPSSELFVVLGIFIATYWLNQSCVLQICDCPLKDVPFRVSHT